MEGGGGNLSHISNEGGVACARYPDVPSSTPAFTAVVVVVVVVMRSMVVAATAVVAIGPCCLSLPLPVVAIAVAIGSCSCSCYCRRRVVVSGVGGSTKPPKTSMQVILEGCWRSLMGGG